MTAVDAQIEPSLRPLTVALVGRPNAGKSSLFNRLTGASARVGNFPGVTVDILEGAITLPSGRRAVIYDLPGLYDFHTPAEPGTDERISVDFVRVRRARKEPLLVVHVLDAARLQLGLALTQSLRSADPSLPLLVVVTQTDILAAEGYELRPSVLAASLGCPVVAVNTRLPTTRALLLAAIDQASSTTPLSDVPPWTPADATAAALFPVDRPLAAISPRIWTERFDTVLLHRVLGPLLFVILTGLLFLAVFLIADPASAFFDGVLQRLGTWTRPLLGNGWFASLVVDGVLGGAGTVLAFVPQVAVLMGAMELLESSGYLARAAFLVDRLFRFVGLGGKAFMPLLTGHACAIPAIAATRVLHDPWERLTTILVIPLMTCSARLPVYSLIITTFFGGSALRKGLICLILYLAGIAMGLIAAMVLRRTVVQGKIRLPLVLEMPIYRWPNPRTVLARAQGEAIDFIRRTGTLIVAASVVLWALLAIPVTPLPFPDSPPLESSAAAALGHALEGITKPLGFDWRINVGLISAFGARELMVGTLGVIFGLAGAKEPTAPLAEKIATATLPDGRPAYGVATAVSLLAFFVIACQCMSTLSAVRRETKSWKWPLFVLVYTYVLAYGVAAVAYQTTRLFVG